MTPYVTFWVPEHVGGSGVLATVAAGLFVSWNGPLLIPAATRLQGIFFWDLLVYLLEGFVFLLTGLQARMLLERTHAFALRDVVLAVLRHHGGGDCGPVYLGVPGNLCAALAQRSRWLAATPLHRGSLPFVIGFVGIRGVVSLAAALAIPLATAAGAPFPDRDLILAITFGVILDYAGRARIAAAEHHPLARISPRQCG